MNRLTLLFMLIALSLLLAACGSADAPAEETALPHLPIRH